MLLAAVTALALCLGFTVQAAYAQSASADGTHRSAIVSAFRPEWLALQESLEGREEHVVNGTVFLTGTIERKPVVLFLSGRRGRIPTQALLAAVEADAQTVEQGT